jgi:hypothetical protein
MLKNIFLTSVLLLISAPVLALEPTEYQFRNFDRRLEQWFDVPSNIPLSETYLRKSDQRRRSDGFVFCSLLADSPLELQLIRLININFRNTNGNEKKFADEFAYTLGLATAAVDTLCTEYRSDLLDFSQKIQDKNFARSIITNESRAAAVRLKNTDLFTMYMNLGYESVKGKNYDFALILFRQALDERPNNPYALKAIENVTSYTNKYSPWQLIGKTSTGETIFLDISSAHFVRYGEASEFDYKFAGKVTTRINKAVTESCDSKTGLINKNAAPEWLVINQNGKKVRLVVKADSDASIQMLDRVCRQSLIMFKKYGIQN